jgi:hypothetical protein
MLERPFGSVRSKDYMPDGVPAETTAATIARTRPSEPLR